MTGVRKLDHSAAFCRPFGSIILVATVTLFSIATALRSLRFAGPRSPPLVRNVHWT